MLRRSAGILAVVYPATVVLTILTAMTMLALRLPVRGSPLGVLLEQGDGGWALWLSTVLGTLVLAPLAEEILFRLVLFEAIRAHIPHRAAILTSMVFAAVHQSPEATPALFLLGMVLQRARQRSGALWLPVTVHAGFNAISLVLYAVFQGLGWGT
ncbi:MAG: hypothetical protein A3K19_22480 [Lentisphaerae bacterium RIFOXYB12_FULL_65_16]|nr:MAG: hypothetical protein A3K18_08960 [Lentisphaerae bacterium RIFOXYA12_64_32]OGV93836.1 MAG: hypothetical protein A3K19_22480 [Lentisphaerae bacterium RIFOXYB12_FULL_65_16]